MPSFSPALIQTMRAVLDEVITKIPPAGDSGDQGGLG